MDTLMICPGCGAKNRIPAEKQHLTPKCGRCGGSLAGAPLSGKVNPLTDPQQVEQNEISAKYQGYIDRQKEEVSRLSAQEKTPLPETLDFSEVRGLSIEVQQRLRQNRPETLGQASRIQGVTPAAISMLLIHLKKINKVAAE